MLGYDLKQAFTYFLHDEHKISKLFVLYFISAFVGIMNIVVYAIDKIDTISLRYILLAFLLFVVLNLYYSGYLAVNLNSRIIKPENKLPKLWDCVKYIAAGFKYCIGIFIYQIVFSILIGLSILLICAATVVMANSFPAGIILLIISIAIFAALILNILLYIVGVSIAFCTNLKFGTMFNSKLINSIISKNFKSLSKVLLIAILFGIMCAVMSVLLCLTIVGIVLIPAVWLILFLAIADIYAQFVRNALNTTKQIEQQEESNG